MSPEPDTPRRGTWVIDQYPGVVRVGWVSEVDDFDAGFFTVVWQTNRTTQLRIRSVWEMAKSKSTRGYVWSNDIEAVRQRVATAITQPSRLGVARRFIDRMEQM